MDEKTIGHDIIRSTNIYLSVYLLILAASVLIISLDNFDLITNFTAVTATLNNIGPGLEIVGPMGNFSSFSYLSKCVLIFDMLAGRLEIFPLMLLFFKGTWKNSSSQFFQIYTIFFSHLLGILICIEGACLL